MTSSATVLCSDCNLPGRVIFDSNGKIKEAFFVCKCPRTPVEETNAAA